MNLYEFCCGTPAIVRFILFALIILLNGHAIVVKKKVYPLSAFMYQAIINTNLVLSNLRRSTKPDILHRVMIEQKLSSSAEAGHEKLSTAVLFPQELRGKVAARCS